MKENVFTKRTAQSKVGKRVTARERWADIPQGTSGTVIGAEEYPNGFRVVVQWHYISSMRPGRPTDFFYLEEYDRYIREEVDHGGTT
jgi:hypothetical protein